MCFGGGWGRARKAACICVCARALALETPPSRRAGGHPSYHTGGGAAAAAAADMHGAGPGGLTYCHRAVTRPWHGVGCRGEDAARRRRMTRSAWLLRCCRCLACTAGGLGDERRAREQGGVSTSRDILSSSWSILVSRNVQSRDMQ